MGAGAGKTGSAGGKGGGGLSATQNINAVTEEQIMENLEKNGVDLNAENGMYGMSMEDALYSAISEYTGDDYTAMKHDPRLKYIFDHTDASVKVKDTKLYRGMTIDADTVKKYKPGQIIQERGVSSWSRDYMVANSFAKINKSPVIFVESSKGVKNAISIEKISGLNEKEVMYAPNQKFKIKSISQADITNKYGSTKHVTVVEVTEI